MTKKFSSLILTGIVFLAAATAVVQNVSGAPKAAPSSPEDTVKQFYRWYVDYLGKNDGKRPPEVELRKFITANYLEEAKKAGDADIFLRSQERDPDWGKNVKVLTSKTVEEGDEGGSHVEVMLSGKTFPKHQLNLALVKESDGWKIDYVQRVDVVW